MKKHPTFGYSHRLRVVSNFGDGDCGAGEMHTRAREIFWRSPRVASPRNFARARVCISPAPHAIAKIRDYSQSSIRSEIDANRSFDSSFRCPTPNKLHLNHRSKSQCNHLFVTQGSYLSISLLVLQNNMFYSKEINLSS